MHKKVFAHCGIPCGMYDPYIAEYHAISACRLIFLLSQKETQEEKTKIIIQLEISLTELKKEINIIWSDYFKGDLYNKEITDITHDIMLAAATVKQKLCLETAQNLLSLTNQFSQYFWSTKNVKVQKVFAPVKINDKALVIVQPILEKSE